MIRNLVKLTLKYFILFIFRLLDCFPIQKRTILIQTVDPLLFSEWSGAQKKKGGQVKMERVMSEEKFKEWESFIDQASK